MNFSYILHLRIFCLWKLKHTSSDLKGRPSGKKPVQNSRWGVYVKLGAGLKTNVKQTPVTPCYNYVSMWKFESGIFLPKVMKLGRYVLLGKV